MITRAQVIERRPFTRNQFHRGWVCSGARGHLRPDLLMVVVRLESSTVWANNSSGNPPECAEAALDLADVMEEGTGNLCIRSISA